MTSIGPNPFEFKLNYSHEKISVVPKQIKVDVEPTIAAGYTDSDFAADCPNVEFVPTIIDRVPPRIIAIGDIHGDLTLAKESFILAGLIDQNLNWIAQPPNTIVVQVGDQIDSCRHNCRTKKLNDRAEDVSVLEFFDSMHAKAKVKGGAVYSLIGNHELMNASHIFSNVSYANLEEFRYQDKSSKEVVSYYGKEGRKRAFQPGGPIAKKIACSRPSVLIVGSIIFIHAGVLPAMASSLDTSSVDIKTKMVLLNKIVRKWLLDRWSKADTHEAQKLRELVIDGSNTPFWTRAYGYISKNKPITDRACKIVKDFLEVYKLGHIVIGHTPQMSTKDSGINSTCYEKDPKTGRLHRVDGGFSTSFDMFRNGAERKVQVLEILHNSDNTYSFNILTNRRSN